MKKPSLFEQSRAEFIEKYQDSEVSILWSGGLDSNVLLLLAIEANCKIRLVTVASQQLPNSEAEEWNRDVVYREIQRMYPDADMRRVETKSPDMLGGYHLAQLQMWLIAMMSIHPTDTILVGYVMGDEAVSFIPDIENLWTALLFNRQYDVKLAFPLVKAHKEEMQVYVRERGLTYLNMYCERPNWSGSGKTGHPVACGVCPSCLRATNLDRVMYKHDDEVLHIHKPYEVQPDAEDVEPSVDVYTTEGNVS
ncbi:hypothetical protein NVP1244A_110 [Vibrio phage 1.244.A._10N.261.54.C3]|nr:hypothetical protein NVP1244A_110 [Vibrio phage 1.244.A._10N.261.54.C3]AUR98738.1 hypothetical protein NVP1255O_110 [Vibrio phage 1.255.O._10N.286.45.F1]